MFLYNYITFDFIKIGILLVLRIQTHFSQNYCFEKLPPPHFLVKKPENQQEMVMNYHKLNKN